MNNNKQPPKRPTVKSTDDDGITKEEFFKVLDKAIQPVKPTPPPKKGKPKASE